jgi:hypothetical protein
MMHVPQIKNIVAKVLLVLDTTSEIGKIQVGPFYSDY